MAGVLGIPLLENEQTYLFQGFRVLKCQNVKKRFEDPMLKTMFQNVKLKNEFEIQICRDVWEHAAPTFSKYKNIDLSQNNVFENDSGIVLRLVGVSWCLPR